MKRKHLLVFITGIRFIMSVVPIHAFAAIGYSTPSAIITQLDGFTASCIVTENGSIVSSLSSDAIPGYKDVNYITKDESDFRHLEYSGSDYLISVELADEAAFVQEYGHICGIAQQSNGSYILCSKDMERTAAGIEVILLYNGYISNWTYDDVKTVYKQICDSEYVDAVRIMQGHKEYSYGDGAFHLHIFASETITADMFTFLPEGFSVSIDEDDKYPSVDLIKDGKPVDDYTQLYEFYCGVLENIPEVQAVYPYYWYVQMENGRMIYEVIEEKNDTATTMEITTTTTREATVTTTAAPDTATTTETTETETTTTETETTVTTETTVWADYTSAPESETIATSDSDLPQTGNNSLNQIALILGALLMLSTGAWAMAWSLERTGDL